MSLSVYFPELADDYNFLITIQEAQHTLDNLQRELQAKSNNISRPLNRKEEGALNITVYGLKEVKRIELLIHKRLIIRIMAITFSAMTAITFTAAIVSLGNAPSMTTPYLAASTICSVIAIYFLTKTEELPFIEEEEVSEKFRKSYSAAYFNLEFLVESL